MTNTTEELMEQAFVSIGLRPREDEVDAQFLSIVISIAKNQARAAEKAKMEEVIALFGSQDFAIDVMTSLPRADRKKWVDFGYKGQLIQKALREKFLIPQTNDPNN